MYIIIAIIILIWIMGRIRINKTKLHDSNLVKKNIDNIQFSTGDIIFYRYNYEDSHFDFNIPYYYCQGYYTHVGIVVVINQIPYVFQMTDNITYDSWSKKNVERLPSLNTIDEVKKYKGVLYYCKYKGSPIENQEIIIRDIFNENIHIYSNFIMGILVNLLGVLKHTKNHMYCCDLVLYVMHKFGVSNLQLPCHMKSLYEECMNNDNYNNYVVMLEK